MQYKLGFLPCYLYHVITMLFIFTINWFISLFIIALLQIENPVGITYSPFALENMCISQPNTILRMLKVSMKVNCLSWRRKKCLHLQIQVDWIPGHFLKLSLDCFQFL